MARRKSRPGPLLALIAAAGLVAGLLVTAPAPAAAADAPLPAWKGGINLYRDGVFTTQKSWLWCTAADVQIIRNIADGANDHTTSGQRGYFDWMRDHNKYDLPESAGVDPQGWTAGLRHFVDSRYRLISSKSFDAALRSAVTNLRRTNLPVAVTVAHGNHGWVLTGFSATADPARTTNFTVTSVRVVGPLFGLQSKNGYDMRPNTKLTTAQFRGFFTPWHYDPKPMIWDGLYVSIQPVAPKPAAPAPAAAPPKATPQPTLPPRPTPPPTSVPTPVATPSPTPTPPPSLTPAPTLNSSPRAVALAEASPAQTATAAPSDAATVATGPGAAVIALVLAGLALTALVGWRIGDHSRRA